MGRPGAARREEGRSHRREGGGGGRSGREVEGRRLKARERKELDESRLYDDRGKGKGGKGRCFASGADRGGGRVIHNVVKGGLRERVRGPGGRARSQRLLKLTSSPQCPLMMY